MIEKFYMKKVKITVLKTTLDRVLAAEYGAKGLTACPMMKEGQVFYADYAKPEGLCDEAWKAIFSMFLHLLTVQARKSFITVIGFVNPVSRFVAVTMVCVPLFSSLKLLMKKRL